MRPITFTYSPTVATVGAVAASQTPTSAVSINGTLASGGVATLGAQQYITIASLSNISNRTFAITGTDSNGQTVSETLTGPNATTVVSAKSYKTVTSATISGLAAGAITMGVDGTGYSQNIPLDLGIMPFSVSCVVYAVTGCTYKLQYTYGPVWESTWPNSTSQTWFDHATLTGKTATADATINNPVTAVRFVVTTAASPQSISCHVIQAGVA